MTEMGTMYKTDRLYRKSKIGYDYAITFREEGPMKRMLAMLVLVIFLLTGCSREEKPYRYIDYTLFDTVTTIVGYGPSEAEFTRQAERICEELRRYHRLFDIYQEYYGIHNLKTVNDQAGAAPVQVDEPILTLLSDCRNYWILTDKTVNPGMGSLLSLWHDARQQALGDPLTAQIPSHAERMEARKHIDFQNLQIDREHKTVYLQDQNMRLDIGAVAKGWAVEQVSKTAPEGLLISVGGNVCATGPKPDGTPWIVGLQNPDGEGYLETVELTKGSAVTSGDYQRFFEAEGKRYHHIIDPDSTLPGEYWRSVTVLCPDSGLADALSTALFLMDRDRGQKLLETAGAEALWVDHQNQIYRSPGFPE